MKQIANFVLLLLLFLASATAMQAKDKKAKDVYAFATGTCLNDSVVYISAIAQLDSATVNAKTKFLQDRQLYSYQFKMFLDKAYSKSHTCAVFFSENKNALEKKYIKLRRRYNKEKTTRFVEVPADQFTFKYIGEAE